MLPLRFSNRWQRRVMGFDEEEEAREKAAEAAYEGLDAGSEGMKMRQSATDKVKGREAECCGSKDSNEVVEGSRDGSSDL
ncbi:hypothetical protein B296_00058334 [Ensete ventricosum]|uniref:Uncharacterized protein n=1 Tax=Ensete ventricosum TaxID=4639 RepID=A0A426WXB8_ENSVE|nr:hypothetical protein B296_00058334 [Ensete ventricosum]